MYFRAIAGVVAGLSAGVISGIMFMLMRVPETDGMTYSLLAIIARAMGTVDASVGWSYHLIFAAIIGIVFGVIVGKSPARHLSAVGRGIGVATAAWILANLILLPQFKNVVSNISGLPISWFGLATLFGYAIQGMVLGLVYRWVYLPLNRVDADASVSEAFSDEAISASLAQEGFAFASPAPVPESGENAAQTPREAA